MSATSANAQHILSALNELVVGLSLPEMAAIIARHILRDTQRIAVNAMASSASGDARVWDALPAPTSRGGQAGRPFFSQLDLPWDALDMRLREQLENGDPFIPGETPPDPALTDWLHANGYSAAVIFPLITANRLLGVFTILNGENDPAPADEPFSSDELMIFGALVNQASVLFSVRQNLDQTRAARNIIDNLALANRLITVAEDYRYMAQAIMYTLARNMVAVGITLFDRPLDENEAPLYRRVVGLCTPDELITVDSAITYPGFLPNLAQATKLRGSLPLIARDIRDGDTYLPSMLFERGADWMGSFGLRSGEKLIGTLDIIHNSDYSFTQEELDGYTTLADHIGVNIIARQLLEESISARQMSARMVETNRRISIAEDYGAIAQALFHVLPDSVKLTSIMLFDDANGSQETPEMVRIEAVATRDAILAGGLTDRLTPEALATNNLYQRLLDGELVIIRDTRDRMEALVPNLVALLHEYGLYTLSAIGMRSGVRLAGVIAFAADSVVAFGGVELDNLRNVASQVAVAIENRSLLDQTNEALSFVAGQYEISSILYRTGKPDEILRALYRFLDRMYATAFLAVTDDPEGNTPATTMRVITEIHDNNYEVAPEGGMLRTIPVPEEVAHADSANVTLDTDRTLILPLITRSRQLLGMMHFSNPEPVELAFNRRRALRNLAEQFTITIENRLLLQRNERALQEARTLYDLNRAVSAARDNVSILRSVREMIAPGAICLAMTSLSYEFLTDRLDTYIVDSVLTNRIGQRVSQPLHENVAQTVLTAMKVRWEARDFEPLYIEDTATWDGDELFINYLKEQGIETRSFLIVPVMDDDLMTTQVCLAFDSPQVFDSRIQRMFNNLRDQLSIIFQNQRLLRDVTASAAQMGGQVRVLQTLNQLAINLNTTQDERILMEDSAQALVNALRIDHAMVVLNNPDAATASVVGEFPPGDLLGIQFDVADMRQQEVRRFRNPVHIASVATDENISEALRQRLLETGVESMTLLPLNDLRDHYIGLIAMDSFDANRELTHENLDVARTIGAQTVVSYQNIIQLRSTQAQAQQLQQLADFSQSIQSRLDVVSILDTVAAETPLIMKFDHLAVMLYDTASQQLFLVAEFDRGRGGKQAIDTSIQFNPHTSVGGYQEISGQLVVLDGTTAERSWFSRSALYLRDIARETSLRHTHLKSARSALVELLYSRGVALGLVEIASHQAYAYTDTDVVIFKQVANQIGIAIENAQAYMQSQRVASSKALVNDISSQLQRQLDMDSILSVTVNELGKALGAKRARIRLTTTAPAASEVKKGSGPLPDSGMGTAGNGAKE